MQRALRLCAATALFLAAAACLLIGLDPPRSLEILGALREATSDPELRIRLDVARARAFSSLDAHEAVLEITPGLRERFPESLPALRLHTWALTRLERWDEARELAQSRLARLPGKETSPPASSWKARSSPAAGSSRGGLRAPFDAPPAGDPEDVFALGQHPG